VIDLGPEGGDAGGRIAAAPGLEVPARLPAAGTPERVPEVPGSYTGAYLARVLTPRLEDAKRRA
jgi:excinuclease ABC subunit A